MSDTRLINLDDEYYDKISELMKINGNKRIMIKTIEEMSELQHELSRMIYNLESDRPIDNFSHTEEEIADTLVMIQQVMLMNDIDTNTIEDIIKYKIDRQTDRFKRENKNKKNSAS